MCGLRACIYDKSSEQSKKSIIMGAAGLMLPGRVEGKGLQAGGPA